MRAQHQAGYVLHTRAYRETSLLVDLFTLDHGRLSVLAKGVRQGKKARSRALLQPFQPLLLGWSGRGELPVLSQCDAAGAALALGRTSLWCGFYVNELLVRLLHRHDPHPGLYDAYANTLLLLAKGDPHEAALRLFEKQLLKELGYALELDRIGGTETGIAVQHRYRYLPQRGLVEAGDGDPATPSFSGATLLALDREHLDDGQVLREAKLLMRVMIAYHLGRKPIHTRKLFRAGSTGS